MIVLCDLITGLGAGIWIDSVSIFFLSHDNFFKRTGIDLDEFKAERWALLSDFRAI